MQKHAAKKLPNVSLMITEYSLNCGDIQMHVSWRKCSKIGESYESCR